VRYFLCIFCPPLAVLLCGKPFSAIAALFLWFCFWLPGSIYAFVVVSSHKADKRARRIERAILSRPIQVQALVMQSPSFEEHHTRSPKVILRKPRSIKPLAISTPRPYDPSSIYDQRANETQRIT
jgi:uncharacterized membrane protein YqaE (UPF0057 family)